MTNLLKKRTLLENITRFINNDQIIVITGMRQVGKTSLIRLILEQLRDNPVYYFDLEDFTYLDICNKGHESFVNFLKLQGADFSKRLFVAIDEIQYLENPSNFLKLLHDHYPSLKLIVSGSSSLEIKSKFKDSLAGRKIVFELDPLSFNEFLLFRNEELLGVKTRIGNILNVFKNDINESMDLAGGQFSPFINEYLMFGGYPGVALMDDTESKKAILRDIYSSYVRKDIKDIATVEDVYGFNNLLRLIAGQIGSLLNINELSSSVGLSVNTVKKYLFILENTFIITLLRPYHVNSRKELTKMPKPYFHDVGLRNTVLGNYHIQAENEGKLFENIVFSELKKQFIPNESLFFWRTTTGAEVDFVVKFEDRMIPLEVKASEMKKPAVSKSLRSFIDTFAPEKAIILNKNMYKKILINNTNVIFLPLYAL
jgi:predicted AAA+ superfamily ATPase